MITKEEKLIGAWKKVFGRRKISIETEGNTITVNKCILIKPHLHQKDVWSVSFRNKRGSLYEYASRSSWRETVAAALALNAELLVFINLKEDKASSLSTDINLQQHMNSSLPPEVKPTSKFAYHFFPHYPPSSDVLDLISEYGLEVFEHNSLVIGVTTEAENNTLATEFVRQTFANANIAGKLKPAPYAQ